MLTGFAMRSDSGGVRFYFVITDRGRPREMGGRAMSESVRVPGWLASGKSTPSSLPACPRG